MSKIGILVGSCYVLDRLQYQTGYFNPNPAELVPGGFWLNGGHEEMVDWIRTAAAARSRVMRENLPYGLAVNELPLDRVNSNLHRGAVSTIYNPNEKRPVPQHVVEEVRQGMDVLQKQEALRLRESATGRAADFIGNLLPLLHVVPPNEIKVAIGQQGGLWLPLESQPIV